MIKLAFSLFACLTVAACSTAPKNHPAVLSPFGDGNQWIVWQDMNFSAQKEGKTIANIRVPRGFVTDLASTPRRFWSLYPPFGKYLSAAILHDYLYWTQICDRDTADNVFYETMKASGVDQATQAIFLMVLKSQGELAWQENNAEKQKGLVRVIPDKFLDSQGEYITRNTHWPELRTQLLSLNVQDTSAPNPSEMLSACQVLSGSAQLKSAQTNTVKSFLGLSL